MDFAAYKKFTDSKAAENIVEILKENDIECLLQDDQHSYLKIVGYNQVDFGVTLNIKGSDFAKADKILEEYYSQNISNVDKDYYLLSFTDDELKEIITHPFDWGQFDFQLARQILKDKGIQFSDAYLTNQKNEKLVELTQIKKVSIVMLIAGYLLSFGLPPFGTLIGIMIVYNRNLLPNGDKFYLHSAKDRTQGKIIIGISLIWSLIIISQVILRQGR